MIPFRSLVALLLTVAAQSVAYAQEAATCLSNDPSVWPAASRPYFMIIADTSSSLTEPVTIGGNSCGFPNDRRGALRCALRKAITAYAGVANFGLATYATQMTGCDAACTTCAFNEVPGGLNGCGPGSGATRAGANIVVPLVQDDPNAPLPNNAATLLSWVDGSCTGNTELYAAATTPLNGALRDMYRYLSNQWTFPGGGTPLNTPIVGPAGGDRACRSVNVILITDSDENCDTQADVVAAAAQLFTGFTIGGVTFNVRVHVVALAGPTVALADQIAAAGGTTSSLFVQNDTELTTALTAIVTGRLGGAETCNNTDDDCNGCTDEGFPHYCDVGQACCAWGTAPQRQTCLTNFAASITAGAPKGNPALLPCTTASQQTQPASWLCYDPKDVCGDGIDNNCQGGVDTGCPP